MTTKTFTDADAKQAICGIIDAVWGKGVISSNRPENINSDVIAVVTDVVNSIKTCSKYFLAADIAYNFLYTAPGTIYEVLFGMAADMIANARYDEKHNPLATYVNWINVIRGNRQYRACVNTAALHNRSRLEMAFLGI